MVVVVVVVVVVVMVVVVVVVEEMVVGATVVLGRLNRKLVGLFRRSKPLVRLPLVGCSVVVLSSFSTSFKGLLGLGLNRCLGELKSETRGLKAAEEESSLVFGWFSTGFSVVVVVSKLVRTRFKKDGREALGLKRRLLGVSVVVVGSGIWGIWRAGILVKGLAVSSTTASANKFSMDSSARAWAKSCSMDCEAAKDTKANSHKGPESLCKRIEDNPHCQILP